MFERSTSPSSDESERSDYDTELSDDSDGDYPERHKDPDDPV